MMHFIYEEDGITVTMETDATSLYEDYTHGSGVLGHFQRFLAAAGYSFDAEDELTILGKDEVSVDGKSYHEDMDELDRLREGAKGDSTTKSSGQWIEWHGGQCPVDAHYYVEVMLKNAETVIERAGDFYWDEKDDEDAIVRYRVVE